MLFTLAKAFRVATRTNDYDVATEVAPHTPGRVLPRLRAPMGAAHKPA